MSGNMEFYIRTGTNEIYIDIGDEDIKLALAEPDQWHLASGTSWIYLVDRFPRLRIFFHRIKRMLRR